MHETNALFLCKIIDNYLLEVLLLKTLMSASESHILHSIYSLTNNSPVETALTNLNDKLLITQDNNR